MESVSFDSSVVYMNSSLKGLVNASDTDSDYVVYEYKFYINDVLNTSGTLRAWCYQEFANESSACGGVAGGHYELPTWSQSAESAIDGNISTYGYCNNCGYAKLNVSYALPPLAHTASKWIVWYGDEYGAGGAVYSQTIGLSPFNSTHLQLAMTSFEDNPLHSWSRFYIYYNATYPVSWFTSMEGFNEHWIREEGMNWSMGIADETQTSFNVQEFSRFDNLTISARAYDGTNYSSWLNSSTLVISNYAPVFNQSGYTAAFKHHLNVSLQVNATDPENDSFTFAINDSRFTINASSRVINKTTSQSDTGVYNITVNVSDGFNTTSMSFIINITNDAPIVPNAYISPSPAGENYNLTCLNGSAPTDVNGDSITLQYNWFKEGVDQNLSAKILGSGNTTIGENWTCSITPNDGLINGSTVSSQIIQIGQGIVAPIIFDTNATTDSIISDLDNPTEVHENVTVAVNFTDPNNNSWITYFCKSNSANAGGCTSAEWCNSTSSTAKLQSCEFSVSGLSVETEYTYYAFVVDNSSLISSSYSGTFYIGDLTAPLLFADRLSSSSGVNNAPFTIYVNATDANTVLAALVEVTDPNSAKFNYSMSGNGQYSKSFIPSTDGTYYFKFFARDQSNNWGNLDSSRTYTDSTETQSQPSGGDGGTINIISNPQSVCDVVVTPTIVRFTPDRTLYEIEITNNQNATFDPTLKIESVEGDIVKFLEITNVISSVLPGKKTSFGLKYNIGSKFKEGKATLILSSIGCRDLNVSIEAMSTHASVSVFEDLFLGDLSFVELFRENVFGPDSSLRDFMPWASIGILTFLIFIIYSALISLKIIDSIKDHSYFLTFTWSIFIFAATAVTLVFAVTGIRTIF